MRILLTAGELNALADSLLLSTPFTDVVDMVKGQVADSLVDALRADRVGICTFCNEWNVLMPSSTESICEDCLAAGIFE